MKRGVVPRVGRPTKEEVAAREGPQGQAIRALGHRTRRQILLLLEEGEKPVHELAGHFKASRPMVSKHLRILVEAGLVEGRKVGRERWYRLRRGKTIRTALELVRADEAHHDAVQRIRDSLRTERE